MRTLARPLALPLTLTALLAGTLAVAAPAQAAGTTVTDMAALQTAASSCTNGSTIVLGADVLDAGPNYRVDEVLTGCTMTLDLNDHALTLERITVRPGTTLTIRGGAAGTGSLDAKAGDYNDAAIHTEDAGLVIDSGDITASVGSFAAAIGNRDGNFGSITINGGTVDAWSNELSAAIGGGINSTGGTIAINGGTVTAYGDNGGSGIGAGWFGVHDTVTIAGGTVRATGDGGSGIGGVDTVTGADYGPITITGGTVQAIGKYQRAGIGGQGQSVNLAARSDVTAIGGSNPQGATTLVSSVGSADPARGPFGSLTVAGTLRIPADGHLTVPGGAVATVTATGVITGTTGSSDGGRLYGPGTIANAGSIRLPDARPTDGTSPVRITDHHYAVSFDTRGGSAAPAPTTVLARSFAAGARRFPTSPSRGDDLFRGWNSKADGSGTPITATSTLPGSATGGPRAITAYAQYASSKPSPSIGGSPREGRTLRASTGLPAGTPVTYRWKADGRRIKGANGPTLKLGRKQAARRVTVTVTTGGRSATSKATRVVASKKARLVVTPTRIRQRDYFRVTAVGLRSNQRIRVWLGGRPVHLGKADGRGVVDRKVRFSTKTEPGKRRVRVSGYSTSDKRTYTIKRTVRYVSR